MSHYDKIARHTLAEDMAWRHEVGVHGLALIREAQTVAAGMCARILADGKQPDLATAYARAHARLLRAGRYGLRIRRSKREQDR